MSDIPAGLKSAFKALEKVNKHSATLSEDALSVVKDWMDTGSMALNAILSGSFYKGVPKGRITGLVGPTGSGKTLILNKIIGNAQKKDPDVWGVVWDTENAYDPEMARSVGANPDKIKVNPVGTVESCRNEIVTFLDQIIADPSLHGKVIIGIDSLGNLASAKEVADAEKGKDAVDMGMRAKAIKSMLRVLTFKCAEANATLIFTNHVYDDPTAMYDSIVKNQAGGKGPLYMCSVILQLSVTQDKIESGDKDEFIPMAPKVKGVKLHARIVKNRFVPPFLETDVFLNFKSGLYKYSGLLEMAEGYGIIKREGNTYVTKDGEKLGFRKAFKDNDEIWENKILPGLEEAIKEHLTFSSDVDELEKEVEELSDGEEGNEE